MRNNLSKYLRLVAGGEVVLVTDRGQVIAQLAPPPSYPMHPESAEAEALLRLARTGRLKPARVRSTVGQIVIRQPAEAVDMSAVLHEVRRDRS